MVETFEGDAAAFASFPRLALILGATELHLCGLYGTMLDRVRIERDLARHARFDRAALLSRPLAVAGQFDRSAIMATACAAARARQSVTGETRGALPVRRPQGRLDARQGRPTRHRTLTRHDSGLPARGRDLDHRRSGLVIQGEGLTMGDVLTFAPRPKPAAPGIPEPLTDAELRAGLEEAAQTALDATDRIIAVLNRINGCPALEDGADVEPSLASPENPGSQVTWLRGTDQDREADAPEAALPDVSAEHELIPFPPLRWGGHGNLVAAAGGVLLDMLAGERG